MSWYSDKWDHRVYFTVPSAGGTGARDTTATIPADFDHYFANSLANGYDTVLTKADGSTVLDFQRAGSWNHANRVTTLEIDGLDVTTGQATGFWLYYGNSASVTDPTTGITFSSLETAQLEQGEPGDVQVEAKLEPAGETTISQEVAKAPADVLDVYWLLDDLLGDRVQKSGGRRRLEEVERVVLSAHQANGGDLTALRDLTATRLFVDAAGQTWCKTRVIAGTDANDYELRLTVVTTGGQTLTCRARLRVNLPSEA